MQFFCADLSNCQLTSFPEGVFQLLRGVSDNIHVISLANNEMKAISSKFFSTFTQLKGRKICQIVDLKQTYVCCWQRCSLLSGFICFPEVDLQGNVLTKLPDNIAELQHLTAVNLANNSFSAFPDKLTEIATLERINLEGNRIAGKNALICPVVNSDVPKITSFSLFSCFSQQRYPWRNCPTWRRWSGWTWGQTLWAPALKLLCSLPTNLMFCQQMSLRLYASVINILFWTGCGFNYWSCKL